MKTENNVTVTLTREEKEVLNQAADIVRNLIMDVMDKFYNKNERYCGHELITDREGINDIDDEKMFTALHVIRGLAIQAYHNDSRLDFKSLL